jgi:hypothetical protein
MTDSDTKVSPRQLTPEQQRVLRDHGTERPGSSPLNNEKRPGEFQCAGCGAELFDASTGAFVDVFINGGTVTPVAQTFGPDGNLYVVDGTSGSVVRYNGTTGQSMGTFIAAGGTLRST